MFRQRLIVLLLCVSAVWLVLVARLAQIQIGSHDLFVAEDYTSTSGSHLVETVRGGIYARWGTPLAEQVPSFDLAVHYSQLPLACSKPWEHRRIRELIDEFLSATGRPALSAQAASAPAEPDDDPYARAWAARRMKSPRYGSLEDYVRRRVAGESRRTIASEPADSLVVTDWRLTASRICGVSVEDIAAEADRVVERVERIRRAVKANTGWDHVRVVEEDEYHCVIENMPEEVAAALRAEPDVFPCIRIGRTERPAVRVLERTRRAYPNGSLAPHIVGRVSLITAEKWRELGEAGKTWTMDEPFSAISRRYKMDDRVGVQGIEKSYEDDLRGARGYVLYHLAFGLLSVNKESDEAPPAPGNDVYLTIREDMQAAANAALARAAQNPDLDFHSGALIVVDVHSGAVLAAATWPTYDMAALSNKEQYGLLREDPLNPLVFRPLQGAYPTGSIYKIVTATAALEEGKITPQTTFTCRHREVFAPERRSRECTGLHGRISLVPAIEKSCNIYFYHTGLAVGGKKLAEWGHRFGLGLPTGVDLPHERTGQLLAPPSMSGTINLSIGQGNLLCTPLQVAIAVAAVANGGRVYTPHFVDHRCNAQGEVVWRYAPASRKLPVHDSTWRVIREGMRKAVETGTAVPADLGPYRAAVKTGTAQTAGELNHAWTVGFAPYDDPQIAFAVVSEKTSGHGGRNAAPILRYMLEEVRPYDEAGT